MRIAGSRIKWEDQLKECLVMLQALPAEAAVTYEIITVQRKTDGRISHGIIFGKLSRLQTLMRRGHLTLMDATHNTNRLHWKLFTVMIRHEYGNWIPGAHMLSEHEDGYIIATFLLHLRRWCGGDGDWQPHYFLTDDSAAEQRAVGLAFEDLTGDNSVEHFLCRTHSERTLTRNLAGVQCKEAKSHLYAALYLRHTEAGCEESILAAIAAASENKKAYIRQEWWSTRTKWAYYARQHSCMLLQVMTTNAVESWHHLLKTHAGGKEIMENFSLSGVISHVLTIGDQWEQRALDVEQL